MGKAKDPKAGFYREMKLSMTDVDKLIPYARNPRIHSQAQVSQIAASIKEFGWLVPIVVDGENGVIAGHGRLLAAQKMDLKKVPTVDGSHLTEAQRRAFVLADNKLTENAGWDDELLRLELEDLKLDGFDLELTGFSDEEIGRVTTVEGEGGDDPAPPLVTDPVPALGDIWLLGEHRLMCGDSTDKDQVFQLLGGKVPFMMVTDPPYGVDYDPKWRNEALGEADRREGEVQNDHRSDWSEAWALFPGDVAYVWHGSMFGGDVLADLGAASIEVRNQIIWKKSAFSISRGHYNWQHEACWYAVRKGRKSRWIGDHSQSTIWEIASVSGKDEDGPATTHGTQKPLECMARPIRNHGAPGDIVYDPFVGSGTTIIAAERLGRLCYAFEIDPGYCDVAIRRWQEFSGLMATRAGDNKTYAELRDEAGARVGAINAT